MYVKVSFLLMEAACSTDPIDRLVSGWVFDLDSAGLASTRLKLSAFIEVDAGKHADDEDEGDDADEVAEVDVENGADAVLSAVQRLRALPQVVDADFVGSSEVFVKSLFAGVTGLQ